MRATTYLIVFTVFTLSNGFLSCHKQGARPEGVLSEEEMAKALTEFYLKEAKINTIHVSQDSALVLFHYFRKKYAEQANIPDSIIDLSYQYYLGQPVELNAIYDRVIDSLVLKEQRAGVSVK